MRILDYLITTDAKVINELITTSTLENPAAIRAVRFDNKPSWDNWSKKK